MFLVPRGVRRFVLDFLGAGLGVLSWSLKMVKVACRRFLWERLGPSGILLGPALGKERPLVGGKVVLLAENA